MNLGDVIAVAITPALSMLPARMDSVQARAMLVAIGLQESEFHYRRQLGGPARGYWQFEKDGAVLGVMNHRATGAIIAEVTRRLDYPFQRDVLHDAIENNDVLACVFARLLLWTIPAPLPEELEDDIGWIQYLEGWRPGKPHPERWPSRYAAAWVAVG